LLLAAMNGDRTKASDPHELQVEDEGEAERRDQTVKDLQTLWVNANELLEKCEGMERVISNLQFITSTPLPPRTDNKSQNIRRAEWVEVKRSALFLLGNLKLYGGHLCGDGVGALLVPVPVDLHEAEIHLAELVVQDLCILVRLLHYFCPSPV